MAIEPRAATANVKGTAATRLSPLRADITGAKKLFLVVTDGGNGNRFDYADWVEPLLSGPAGDRRLTELSWAEASAGWSEVRVGANALGQPLSVDGQPVPWGLGTHAVSVVGYDLPEGHGWTTFSAKGALDDSSVKQRRKMGSVQFHVYVDALPPEFRGESARAAAVATDRGGRCRIWRAARSSRSAPTKRVSSCSTPVRATRTRAAALRVLRNLHRPEVVTGLISRVEKIEDERLRRGLLTALIRLYFREAEWDGRSWGPGPTPPGRITRRRHGVRAGASKRRSGQRWRGLGPRTRDSLRRSSVDTASGGVMFRRLSRQAAAMRLIRSGPRIRRCWPRRRPGPRR